MHFGAARGHSPLKSLSKDFKKLQTYFYVKCIIEFTQLSLFECSGLEVVVASTKRVAAEWAINLSEIKSEGRDAMKLHLDLLLLLLVLFRAESGFYFIPLLGDTFAVNMSHKILHHLEGIIVFFELDPPAFVLLIIDDGLVAFCLYFPEDLEGLIVPETLEFHVEIVV